MNKEKYEKMILESIREKLKTQYNYNLQVSSYGEKITLDGVNFFNEVSEVEILSHNVPIIKYDLKNKKIKIKKIYNNIILEKEVVDFLNNYIGKEVYRLNKKGQEKLLEIEKKKDEIYDTEGSCDLSDYEISCLIEL